MKNVLTAVAIFAIATFWTAAYAQEGTEPSEAPAKAGFTIKVTVTNIRSDNGHVLLGLYNNGDGFPSKSEKAFARTSVTIKDGVATAEFPGVPAGTWAVGVMHDENDNYKLDRIAGGIPKEGFGASNDAKAIFGPPKFKAAKFDLAAEKSISIKMKYF